VGGTYAELTKMTKGGPVWTGEVRTYPELLDWPLRKKKPLRIFVNSMSDLFHEDVPDWFVGKVFDVMESVGAGHHTFQILTKRAERMMKFLRARWWRRDVPAAMRRNIWLGVSVEDQRRADERIPLLLQTPAAVRWISAEPLLGPVDLRFWLRRPYQVSDAVHPSLNWVVVGGESGPGARPMHPDWARSLRDQCAAAGVPYFFKQWGTWVDEAQMLPDGSNVVERYMIDEDGCPGAFHDWPQGGFSVRIGKRAAGRYLDGRTHDEYPA
jgi:protein gp37